MTACPQCRFRHVLVCGTFDPPHLICENCGNIEPPEPERPRKLPALALIDRVPDDCPPADPTADELDEALPEWAPWTVEVSPLDAMFVTKEPTVEQAAEQQGAGV